MSVSSIVPGTLERNKWQHYSTQLRCSLHDVLVKGVDLKNLSEQLADLGCNSGLSFSSRLSIFFLTVPPAPKLS